MESSNPLRTSITTSFPLETLWVRGQNLHASATRQQSFDTSSHQVFDSPNSCISNTGHHPTFRLADCHGGKPRALRLSLLPRFFWFTPGGGICALLPPISTYRPADVIALARPGKTRSFHMRHLWFSVRISASGGSSAHSPNSTLGQLTKTPSTDIQGILSDVPNALTRFIRRKREIRFIRFIFRLGAVKTPSSSTTTRSTAG